MSILTPTRKLATVFALAAATVLAGCGPHVAVAPPDGQGHGVDGVQCTMAQVFKDAAAQKACVVDAAKLQKGTTYDFDGGLLAVRGDVPDGVSIAVTNGKLYIDGNVQKGADVSARVPEEWSSHIVLMPMPISNGKTTTIVLMPMTQSHFEGYVHANDKDPAVIIHGAVEKGAHVSGNTGAVQQAAPATFNARPAIESTLALW